MLVVTLEHVPGKRIVKVLGMVRGNTIRARGVGHDLLAGLRAMVGGEITDYTKVIAESREQALDRMIEQARTNGANAVVGVRFATCEILNQAAEILAYGTAVVLADE
ncbi:MAG TPA: YbjQ family protein [Candidatus Krumholzibacteria bacterium]|nr:YbjQ family protein [Candidatus Krumholzibacteria bacterium]HPD72435.1 YbjQ family protein [Candidatus Krumholzibacteria bacterium]HRY40633.1 YbjQ family protein [Candidatus Krumholzibacteria bacterium]